MTKSKLMHSRIQGRRDQRLHTRQDRWARSYRLIAFDALGRHKFAVTVLIPRYNFSRLTEEDKCEYEPEKQYQPQLSGLYDLLQRDILSYGKSWTNLNFKEVDGDWERDEHYESVKKYSWMRLRLHDTHTKASE